MTRGFSLAALLPFLLLGGCLPNANQTTVLLTNSADFPVTVQLFYSDQQEVTEELLKSLGTEVNVALQPQETFPIARDCDNLQAVIIADSELQVIGGIGPNASTRVYRDGDDFNCGDTVIFTFSQDNLGTQLDISFSEQAN